MSEVLSRLTGGQLDRIMELARRHLEMDVVFVAEFAGDKQIYRALHGSAASFGMKTGEASALASGYCYRMVRGTIPNAIPDTAADARVRDLAVTTEARIGAYVGVPVRLADGSTYGSFCCLSHNAHDLGERDVRFLLMLADLVTAEVEALRERESAKVDISHLIDLRAFDIALQPIFDLNDGCCLGMEALARFPAKLGATERVFELAYEAGLGAPLERLALGCAIDILPALAQQQYLSVNLTPQVVYDLAAAGEARSDLFPRLVLEITEHAAVDNYVTLRRSLQSSRQQGLRLAIDDAGAGYASLKHIVELEPDIIKIDRSLVSGVAGDRTRRSVVTAFVLLALDLGASVIAEGVERSADLEAVKDLGVDAAQGYLLARPTTDRTALARWERHGHNHPSVRSRQQHVRV